jgi:hypothetical protein
MYLWFQKQLWLPFPRASRVRVWFVVVGGLRDFNEVLCGGIMDAEVIRRQREMACTVEG